MIGGYCKCLILRVVIAECEVLSPYSVVLEPSLAKGCLTHTKWTLRGLQQQWKLVIDKLLPGIGVAAMKPPLVRESIHAA